MHLRPATLPVTGRELARLAARADAADQIVLAEIVFALAAAVHLDLDPLGDNAALDLADFGRKLLTRPGSSAPPPAR